MAGPVRKCRVSLFILPRKKRKYPVFTLHLQCNRYINAAAVSRMKYNNRQMSARCGPMPAIIKQSLPRHLSMADKHCTTIAPLVKIKAAGCRLLAGIL